MISSPVVTFITEYGTGSPYVARLKGELLKRLPDVRLVDISNEVGINDVLSTSYLIKTTYPSFPSKSIHLIGVDMNPARYGKVLIALCEDQFFIGTDNGLFSLAFAHTQHSIYEWKPISLQEHEVFPELVIFPELVERIVREQDLSSFAHPLDSTLNLQTLSPVTEAGSIRGRVVFIDGYGNVITDISTSDMKAFQGKNNFEILHGRRGKIRRIADGYEDEKSGEVLAVMNSSGFLELAIRRGKASELLGLKTGSNIIIEFYD